MGAPQLSPEFHVHGNGVETLWDGGERYYVIRNGEMRILFRDGVIRYTDDLLRAGITNDVSLEKVINDPEVEFVVVDSPWYEVVDSSDPTDEGEVYFDLDEAVERAQALEARLRGELGV